MDTRVLWLLCMAGISVTYCSPTTLPPAPWWVRRGTAEYPGRQDYQHRDEYPQRWPYEGQGGEGQAGEGQAGKVDPRPQTEGPRSTPGFDPDPLVANPPVERPAWPEQPQLDRQEPVEPIIRQAERRTTGAPTARTRYPEFRRPRTTNEPPKVRSTESRPEPRIVTERTQPPTELGRDPYYETTKKPEEAPRIPAEEREPTSTRKPSGSTEIPASSEKPKAPSQPRTPESSASKPTTTREPSTTTTTGTTFASRGAPTSTERPTEPTQTATPTQKTTVTPPPKPKPSTPYQERILNFTGRDVELPNMIIHDHIRENETNVDPLAEVESRLYILNDLQLQLEDMEKKEGDDFFIKLAFSKELLDRALDKMRAMRHKLADWEEDANRPHSRKRRTSYFVSAMRTNTLSATGMASLQVHLLKFKQQDFCETKCMYNITWHEVGFPNEAKTKNVTWGKDGGITDIEDLKFRTKYIVKTCIMNQPEVDRVNDFYCNTRAAWTQARNSQVNDVLEDILDGGRLPFEGFDEPGGRSVGGNNNNANNNDNNANNNDNNNDNNANNNDNNNANSNNNNVNNNQQNTNNQNTNNNNNNGNVNNNNGQQNTGDSASNSGNNNDNNNNNDNSNGNNYWQWCPTDRCTCGCS